METGRGTNAVRGFACVALLGMLGSCEPVDGEAGEGASAATAELRRMERVEGRAVSGELGLGNLEVSLRVAGTSRIETLGRARTRADGRFVIRYRTPPGDPILYVVARGARPSPVGLVSVLGPASSVPYEIVVNELTTVASVWTSAPFFSGDELIGHPVGVRNAATNAGNLVDIERGRAASPVLSAVNVQTTTLAKLYSLGDILSTCVRGIDCDGLFDQATSPDGTRPRDTLEAALNIARFPWNHVEGLYGLLPPPPTGTTPIADVPYLPYLRYRPADWTLSLVYTGGGLDAPGGIAFDARGYVWTNNNFLVGSQSFLREMGFPGLGATLLTPNGRPLSPDFGFTGGGIFGAGFGIAIDQRGHVWIGNFAGRSLSELDPHGRPLSPDGTGYPAPGQVQGTVVDQRGNIWVANFSAASITMYPAGNPERPRTYGGPHCAIQMDAPFGLAVDHDGNVWAASEGSGTVVRVDPDDADRCPDTEIPAGARPMGVAIDSEGMLWVANLGGGDVTMVDPTNAATTHFGAGFLTGPWGIAVDGADNVWVADFFGRRVVQICGASGDCPSGFTTGQVITPPAGYVAAGGMQHITDVAIDPSGNVWLANNNHDQPRCDAPPPLDSPPSVELDIQSMSCGGNGVVVLFGVAAPVATPLIGPPRQPGDTCHHRGRRPGRGGCVSGPPRR